MNGSVAKLLRKVAETIGRDPKYIKKYYKEMSSGQQQLYRTYIRTSLAKLGKEDLNGKELPTLRESNSPAK